MKRAAAFFVATREVAIIKATAYIESVALSLIETLFIF